MGPGVGHNRLNVPVGKHCVCPPDALNRALLGSLGNTMERRDVAVIAGG
ncbi:hypothetical protein APASM_3570 [Actinosynnema pretiosum subsp. pretiosum]|nr:hypothetical protein APASM_3570 [Actinosynnema pretiosum subsp. pretiosum]